MRMKSTTALLLTLFLATTAYSDDAYNKEIAKWQTVRLEHLKADDGWPTLAGLFWLSEGDNVVGSDSSSPVTLPAAAPKKAGVLKMQKGKVEFVPEKGSPFTLAGKSVTAPVPMVADVDAKDEPTTLRSGPISFFVIKRGPKTGVRVRDSNSPARKALSTLEYYPVDTAWRVNAKFEPYPKGKKIPIVNILGMVEQTDCAGALAFKINGAQYKLDVMEEEDEKGEKELFVIFADKTNAKETYGSGRYIYTAAPDKSGNVVLDFNKAYNPPCAFTPYATCPLPPKQNHLPIAIPAGEKKFHALTSVAINR